MGLRPSIPHAVLRSLSRRAFKPDGFGLGMGLPGARRLARGRCGLCGEEGMCEVVLVCPACLEGSRRRRGRRREG